MPGEEALALLHPSLEGGSRSFESPWHAYPGVVRDHARIGWPLRERLPTAGTGVIKFSVKGRGDLPRRPYMIQAEVETFNKSDRVPANASTGTYPPWRKPLLTSPTRLTGVRDGDSEGGDDRGPSRQQQKPAGAIQTVEPADLVIRTLAGVTRERTPLRPTTPEPDRAAGPR